MQLFKQHPGIWKYSDVLSLNNIISNGLFWGGGWGSVMSLLYYEPSKTNQDIRSELFEMLNLFL